MLEEDKGSREKVPSTEAILDTLVHSSSAVPIQSYCPGYKQKGAHIAQTNDWKPQLHFRHHISLDCTFQTVTSGSGHRGGRESTRAVIAKGKTFSKPVVSRLGEENILAV